MKLIQSILLMLALLLLLCGCQAPTSWHTATSSEVETTTEAEAVSLPAAERHYDHMVYELSMETKVYTPSDRVFFVAIRGTKPGWFGIGERWRLSRVESDGTITQLGECPYETAIELEPAEGEEYVHSTLRVGLDMLGIQHPLTPGTYLLQYVDNFPGEDGMYVLEPVYSLYFAVVE